MSSASGIATSSRRRGFDGSRWLLPLTAAVVLFLSVALFSTPASAIQTGCTRSGQTVKCAYNNNEEAQFTVPPGITSVAVDAIGGTGGGNTSSSCAPLCGGKGANVSGSLAVSPGQRLDFDVASNASNGGGGQGYALNGSFASGGSGCWGGGGASAIWQDGTSTPLVVAAGGGGNGCPAGMGGDPATQGGNADAPGAAGTNAYDGRPGAAANGALPGAGGAGGQPISTNPPPMMGSFGGAGSAGNFGGGGRGGSGAFAAGDGGGGGGGLGGGGGGGGGGNNAAGTVGGSGGGGGGGSSLVPSGGSRSLDTTRAPAITISFLSNLTFTSPAPPAATIGSFYTYQYTVVGDTEITYSVAVGSLPPGLTLGQTGALQGAPQTPGTYAFTIAASDGSTTVTRRDTIAVTGATATPRAPVAGKTANASLAWGVILIKRPKGGFAQLGSGTKSVPLGSTVDATRGGVKIETSTRTQKKKSKPTSGSGQPKSSVSTGTFSVGIFAIEQARARAKVRHRGSVKARATQVMLKSAKDAVAKAGCRPTGRPGKGVVRTVHGVTKGDYQIVGASSVTSVTNATWTVQDLCDGTMTTLQSGRATVTSLRGKGHKAHHLRAGQSLLIKGRFL